jgi:hypothetical protein
MRAIRTLVYSIAILFSVLILVTANSSSAGIACSEFFDEYTHVPANVTYWGSYICKYCAIKTPAMPHADKVTRCDHCGSPHRGEPFIAPLTKTIGGELYVLNPGGLGDFKIEAASGLKWECPSCNTANFQTQKNCPNCSNQQPENLLPHIIDENHNYVNRDRIAAKSQTELNRENPANDSMIIVNGKQVKLNQDSLSPVNRNWKAWLKRGSVVLASVTAGAILWGAQTFSEPGFVKDINDGQITIEYIHDGTNHSIELDPSTAKSGVRWHNGEPVVLHFSNITWLTEKLPVGAERSNAEIYVPVLMERGSPDQTKEN